MAKRTKTQKKRLARDMWTKARELFSEGLITPNALESVRKLYAGVLKKL